MNLIILATICSLAAPERCREVQVTTSEQSGVTLQACQMGQPQLAAFMAEWPAYRLVGWKCQIGNRGERT